MVSTNVSQTAHDKIAAIGKKARAASLIMAKGLLQTEKRCSSDLGGFAWQESGRSAQSE